VARRIAQRDDQVFIAFDQRVGQQRDVEGGEFGARRNRHLTSLRGEVLAGRGRLAYRVERERDRLHCRLV
jgi:hypothetical protein